MWVKHPSQGWVPTYGGPYDSYTIPVMGGLASEPFHERPLECERFDHDEGSWCEGTEEISLRVTHEDALASAPAGAGEGEQHAPVSPELDATMLWLGETRDSLRAMADRANQLLTAHCRAALAGEPAVAADEGRACQTEDDCTQMPWCRIKGKCQRAASQDEQQEKQA